MKSLVWKIGVAIFVALPQVAFANDSATEIEIDPIAYALSGYSFHLGEYVGAWKFDLNTASEGFSESLTKSLLGNNDFSSKFVSYGAKIDYIGPSHAGFHVGLQWDYSQWTYTNANNDISATNNTQDAGIRLGYRWGAGALYIDPWVGFLYNYQGTGSVSVGGQNYTPKSFQIFPTVHIGLRF